MASSAETLRKIDEQIRRSDTTICRHIETLDSLGRGAVSQDILANLRTFVEHIMFKIYAHSNEVIYDYPHIEKAISFVKTKGQLKFLSRFHVYLQSVASHYTLDPQNSERIMLKYYEFMLKIKTFLQDQYQFGVLANLNQFPLNTDKNLQEYHTKIAEKFTGRNYQTHDNVNGNERFYIRKMKPFFVKHKIYYEVTISPATDRASKFDRLIAFTTLEISKYYAVKLQIVEDNIEILDKTMPILIISDWEVAIRPIEIEKFANIFGLKIKKYASYNEARAIMKFLTDTGFNLVELISLEENHYQETRLQVLSNSNAKVNHLFDLFERCRKIIGANLPSSNILRYLLYHMNNQIISKQLCADKNNNLSSLYLENGCIPFDKMPFSTSLLGHNPRIEDLFDCIDPKNREHELLTRSVLINTEIKAQLYTSRDELEKFGDVSVLANTFNCKLYSKHQGRRLDERNGHFYIKGYEEDTIEIIKKLIGLSGEGVQNYSNYFDEWIRSGTHGVDCEEKKKVLEQIFVNSSVAIIYGSAGTGKSTLINHISNLFKNQSKLFLANTNPAVDNMQRRVTAGTSNSSFMTITKLLTRDNQVKYDIVVIDECSTVSNRDMRKILKKAKFELLVLVGDIYQIEAIRFGNWFSIAEGFLPSTSVYKLTKPYRSHTPELQTLWDRVRNMEDTILESIARNNYSTVLDPSIFTRTVDDEIVLCLNYDGLYGINNVNRFLQDANPQETVSCGHFTFKIGDPILFNESERFSPVIYNNVKGWIVDIKCLEGKTQFDVEVDKVINGLEARNCDFQILEDSPNGRSLIRFCVDDSNLVDDDGEVPISAVLPFQVAYAVSIHKAQGLEYDSVKIVITDEIDERITHNIFYTAITRARRNLKIYWTPEVEKKVLETIHPKNNSKDIAFLKQAMEWQ